MRIAIVNDLRLACEALRRVVRSAPEHEVAWTAANGVEAVDRATTNRPDLILMDLIMPKLDGAEATRQIMERAPCPILVVTSSVTGNIAKVCEAMGHGALDAVDTPSLGPGGELQGAVPLLEKIRQLGRLMDLPSGQPPGVAQAGPGPSVAAPARSSSSTMAGRETRCPLVLLGASTGGPHVLAQILADLPADLPAAVVVAQHVDEAFAPGLVRWLRDKSRLPVELIQAGHEPIAGRVQVAQTNDHLVLGHDCRLRYSAEPRDQPYRPSIDVLFGGAAAHWPRPGVAVLLTGMGRDGGLGLLALRKAGWLTIAQDQPSCVVWGMPKAAVELGAAQRVLAPPDIASAILTHFRRKPV